MFKRRIYHNLKALLRDLKSILSQRREIRSLMKGHIISPAFRERLMLVVTSVNQCRYCSYAHAREALSTGISAGEIKALAEGMFDESPAEETPALLYAQHWAETDGAPEEIVRKKVTALYGEPMFKQIELTLRMIRMGNLFGNTVDYLLYRVSFGRWGNN